MKCFQVEGAGKAAVIADAASGKGLRAARDLVACGAKVMMCDVNGNVLAR